MQEKRPHETVCGAKTRAGTPCQNYAMPNGRCRMHGGKSLNGIAATDQRAGLKYSKYLPGRLLDRYQTAVNDSELLELRQEVALIDTRLTDLLKRVDTGESGKLWADTLATWEDMKTAVSERDKKKQQQAAAKLDGLIGKGAADYQAWSEIQTTIEQRRRLVESERKRLVEMQQYITSQQAMTLVAAMIGIIKENVRDRDALQNISTAVNGLVAANYS